MNIDLVTLLPVGIILGLAGLAQSAVGFGYALFATPLLVWIGVPLPQTITLVATCSTIQAAFASRRLHADVPWSLALSSTAVRLVCIVVGLVLLKSLVTLRADQIKVVIGGTLCLLVAIQFFWRPRPVEAMHWGWAGLAWSASGLLSGLCGMGGPPLVLWSMAHDWSTEKTRGFLFAVSATSTPFQIALLCATFGTAMLWSVAIGVAFLPIVYLGFRIGLPIGNRMPKAKLRRISLMILMVIGVLAMAQATRAIASNF